jgi:hypothetical protein
MGGESPEMGGVGLSDGAYEDAKAFNKGKGKLLAGMLGIVAAAVGGFAWYLVQDQPNPYGELGKQVNGLRAQYFDGYVTCALPGTRPVELKSDADLRTALHERAASGARYGTHLRQKCVPSLRELGMRLRALLPPEDASPKVKAMADAVSKIEVGTSAYATYLEGLEGPYRSEDGESEQAQVVLGWYEFRKSHAEVNQLVKEKLGR